MKKPSFWTIVGGLATAIAAAVPTFGFSLPTWAIALLTCAGGIALKVSPGKQPKPISGFPEE